MPRLQSVLRPLPLGTILGAVALLGGVGWGLTRVLEARLSAQIISRTGTSLEDVVRLQQAAAEDELRQLGVEPVLEDLLVALLDSARLRGVLALEVFDPAGERVVALPDLGRPRQLSANRRVTETQVRYRPDETVERALGWKPETGAAESPIPLLEVVIPLVDSASGGIQGYARYWLEGNSVAEELGEMRLGLRTQAGIICGVGALLLSLALGGSFWALERARWRLERQREDLVQANRELIFRAKTSALGALSAHLIHGLKNPLAGLEGYLADLPAEGAKVDVAAWQEATLTARRVRALINEVVQVLGAEATDDDSAAERLPIAAVVAKVLADQTPRATREGIELSGPAGEGEAEMGARQADILTLVLNNLVSNALDAVGRGGRVELRVTHISDAVAVDVVDDGPGLPAAVQARLFEPLTSSKPGGGGIGLAISRQLIGHAAGRLELVKTSAEGTCFRALVFGVVSIKK